MTDLTPERRQIRGCLKSCTEETHERGCTSNDAVIGRADPELAAQKRAGWKQYRREYGDPLKRVKVETIDASPSRIFIGVSPKDGGQFPPRRPQPLPKVKAPSRRAWLGWKLIKLGRYLTGEQP